MQSRPLIRWSTWWPLISAATLWTVSACGIALYLGDVVALVAVFALYALTFVLTGIPVLLHDRRPLRQQFTVRVFHNLTAGGLGLRPYAPGHLVTEVFRTDIQGTSPQDVCEQVFELLNVGHEPAFTDPVDPRAVQYRDRGNHSLSIGDVIAVDGTFYACEWQGFQPIEIPHILSGGAREPRWHDPAADPTGM